jgi:hypothetical protein
MTDSNRKLNGFVVAALVSIALLLLVLFFGQRTSPTNFEASAPVARTAAVPETKDVAATEATVERAPIVAAAKVADPAQDEDPAKHIGTILGRILDQRTETPIAGARVTCKPRFESDKGPDVLAVSGPDGRFRLETPYDVVRMLRVDADGFATWFAGTLALPMSERDLQLAPKRLVLGDIRLHRGARPLVRVLDTGEKPCKSADLFLFQGTNGDLTSFATRYLGATDEHGEWKAVEPIALEVEGMHVLAMTPDGLGWTPLDLVSDGSIGQLLEVKLHPSGDIAVHVQDESGAPIENVAILTAPRSYPIGRIRESASPIGAKDKASFRPRLSAITDSRGDARVRSLPSDGEISWDAFLSSQGPGSWDRSMLSDVHVGAEPRVVVMKHAHLVHAIVGTVLDREGKAVASSVVTCGKVTTVPDAQTGAYRLDIPASAVKNVVVSVRATGYRASRIAPPDESKDPLVVDYMLDATSVVAGVVEDSSGHPLAGVSLYLREGQRIGSSTMTKEDGSFAFLDAFGQALEVDVPGFSLDGSTWARVKLAVKSGDRDVHVVLQRGLLDLPTGTLHARVVDSVTGAPVPVLAAHVVPEIAFGATAYADSRRDVRDIGELRVRGLADCRWRAWILSTEGRTASVVFTISPSARDADIEIPVSPLRAIRGRVRLDGKPLTGAPVSVLTFIPGDWQPPPDFMVWGSAKLVTHRQTQLAEDGTFRIEGLVPAEYVVIVRGAGVERTVKVTVTANEDADVTIDAKRIETPAEITIHGLERGFDDFLFVRIDDGSPTPDEFDVETHNRTETTFKVAPGHMDLFVFPSKGKNLPAPPPGTQWIKKVTLDLAPGEKHTVEIFPR